VVLNLVSVEIWYPIDDHPWQRTAKVNELMHHERHNTGCEDIVLHVGIPCSPHPLENIEVNVVSRNLVELAPVGVWRRREQRARGVHVGQTRAQELPVKL